MCRQNAEEAHFCWHEREESAGTQEFMEMRPSLLPAQCLHFSVDTSLVSHPFPHHSLRTAFLRVRESQ